MGDEAEALSEWVEDREHVDRMRARRRVHPVFFESAPAAKSKSKKKKKAKAKTKDHHPATDEEARAIIKKLGTYKWDTHKVSGRFTHNPYTLTATIEGKLHTIHLPGRFGGTLTWLKGKLDRTEGVA